MKKIMMVVLMVSLSAAAFAEQLSDSAGITLSGRVEKRVAIEVVGLAGYNELDLTINVVGLEVATVTEYSNVRGGYTVALSSANAAGSDGAFFRGQDGGETLSYAISYGGSAVILSGGSAEVTNANGKTGLNGEARTLAISYSAEEAHLGDDLYSDDLTFTITAK
jgi:hypothetical protein